VFGTDEGGDMGTRPRTPRGRTSALDILTAAEKGQVLDQLLADRPELRELAEDIAVRQMSGDDRAMVADEVESALRYLDIEEVNGKAGYRSGIGYVHPGEAADEILDEALQPFLDDLARRGELGMTAAAVESAVGILCGLYQCRDGESETLLEYSPDYAGERALDVVDRCAKLGVELPVDELLELIPEWSGILPAVGKARKTPATR
jgi:hypothetical protein